MRLVADFRSISRDVLRGRLNDGNSGINYGYSCNSSRNNQFDSNSGEK